MNGNECFNLDSVRQFGDHRSCGTLRPPITAIYAHEELKGSTRFCPEGTTHVCLQQEPFISKRASRVTLHNSCTRPMDRCSRGFILSSAISEGSQTSQALSWAKTELGDFHEIPPFSPMARHLPKTGRIVLPVPPHQPDTSRRQKQQPWLEKC